MIAWNDTIDALWIAMWTYIIIVVYDLKGDYKHVFVVASIV